MARGAPFVSVLKRENGLGMVVRCGIVDMDEVEVLERVSAPEESSVMCVWSSFV